MKFMSSNYDTENGISTVVIKHRNINFYGTAKLHPDDKLYGSMYTGCTLAEIRATIRALKLDLELAQNETKHWKNYLNACINCKSFDKETNTAKVMFKQYNKQVKKVKELKNQIKDLKNQEKLIIDTRSKYIKKKEEAIKNAEELSKDLNNN